MKRIFFVLTTILFYVLIPMAEARVEKAIFAGGCFWCMEPPFDKTPGVLSTISGYVGGKTKNPTYEEVSAGDSGHYEALEVTFNSDMVSYSDLLKIFWKNIDPYDSEGQFCDKGQQYASAIFYLDDEQRKLAIQTRQKLKNNAKVKTQVLAMATFYKAEDYHQDYYIKNPVRYKYYRYQCGRDKRLEELWGK